MPFMVKILGIGIHYMYTYIHTYIGIHTLYIEGMYVNIIRLYMASSQVTSCSYYDIKK